MQPKESRTKLVLGVEYLGTKYHGWQKQTSTANTIQAVLEGILSQIADEEVISNCSGRTDTGVHAFCQVINFSINSVRKEKAWIMGANSLLPDDIKIVWVREVIDDFHARFSALSRTYAYLIRNTDIPSALWANRCLTFSNPLDCKAMEKASKYLLGEHDFSSFRSSSCQSKSPDRNITGIEIKKRGHFISLQITANAFLYNMVRIIVGTLLDVGEGSIKHQEVKEILALRDRDLAGKTAKAEGLYFMGPVYEKKYNIPNPKEHLFKI